MAKLDFPDRDQSPWTNPDTGVTYVWKGGPQGAWHIASAGDTDIFVAKTGDKMTGDLTLGPEGDTNITLNATDGSAKFAGDLEADRLLIMRADALPTTNVFGVNDANDIGDTRSKFIIKGDGTTLIGGTNIDNPNLQSPNIKLNANGSAEFAEEILPRQLRTTNGQIQANLDTTAAGQANPSGSPPSDIPVIFTSTSVVTNGINAQNTSFNLVGGYYSADGSQIVTTSDIDWAGNATFAGNVTTPGVVFGTPSGNATSKTLDDYEEGTWTPTLLNGGTVRDINSATYVKIGRLVTANMFISVKDIPNDSQQFHVGGLPFDGGIVQNFGGGNITYSEDFDTSVFTPIVQSLSDYIYFHRVDGANRLALHNSNFTGMIQILLQVAYMTA